MTPEIARPRALDVELYSRMALVRKFEEAAYRAYESGEIAGTIHASIGQEAAAVGVMAALRPADRVLSHHRAHGHALSRGVSPAALMAELFGRSTGLSHGKGGSMHVTDVGCGFLASVAIVGGSVPVAVGVALAQRLAGAGAATAVFFGDGGVNQGVLYESFNLAAIWRLPVLFVCENNGYAISVRADYATAGPGVVERARSFGLDATSIDGQEVSAVRDEAARLVERVRSSGPALLELRTYRYVGHSRGDPAHGPYRSREEVEEWRRRDPLALHAERSGIDPETRERLDADAEAAIAEAVALARAAAPPRWETVTEDVWGER